MATTIINPAPSNNSSDNNGMGFLIGAIVLIVVVFLFFVYVLPAIQNIKLGTPQINVPGKIDVNVHQTK